MSLSGFASLDKARKRRKMVYPGQGNCGGVLKRHVRRFRCFAARVVEAQNKGMRFDIGPLHADIYSVSLTLELQKSFKLVSFVFCLCWSEITWAHAVASTEKRFRSICVRLWSCGVEI